ncbi:MAG TPA: folylpolyglutamate synthase/dihydrofolate synthase family protein [Pyrinomonadaceae bacterium]
MNFAEAVKYLLSLGHETLTIKLGLRNTELLLQALNNPERSFKSVQIAGTNGKGSTCAFLDSICRQAGIKTGLYTSPHLESITERIKVNGANISDDDFARYTTLVRDAAQQLVADKTLEALPTFFEQVTAIGLVALREAGVELAILETGLGGRLDSTTAANASVCAITQIAFDHEEYLGHTIEEIAGEKAAIIRPDSKVAVAPQKPDALAVILKRCEDIGVTPLLDQVRTTVNDVSTDGRFVVSFNTPERQLENVSLGLRGRHQIENAAVAIQLTEILSTDDFSISSEAIVNGLQTASHPGRLELIRNVLLDGAHNPAGASALREFLTQFGPRPLTIVFGAMRDKRLVEIAELLFPLADELVLTEVNNPRTARLDQLERLASLFKLERVTSIAQAEDALHYAIQQAPPEGMICITGSLYLIGELRSQVKKQS